MSPELERWVEREAKLLAKLLFTKQRPIRDFLTFDHHVSVTKGSP